MGNEPRVLIIDTYYPQFIEELPAPSGDYEEALREVLDLAFGTADFYSRNLNKLGFDAIDIIANHHHLQETWHEEKGDALSASMLEILKEQVNYYNPDIVFCQDLSLLPPDFLRWMKRERGIKLMAQCSCPMPAEENVREFETIFTSFPHYVDAFRKLGVRAVYNPLAFESKVLDRFPNLQKRTYDVAFIGGVGTPSHWSYGMQVLEKIAKEIPNAFFWGYGYDILPARSYVRGKHVGQAWGLSMYSILLKSKIVVNRHGEVALNYANNMKLYETTGCGALLLTDQKSNLHDIFRVGTECLAYSSAEDAVAKIHEMLADDAKREKIAAAGQQRTLADHTYQDRMKTVARIAMEMLR